MCLFFFRSENDYFKKVNGKYYIDSKHSFYRGDLVACFPVRGSLLFQGYGKIALPKLVVLANEMQAEATVFISLQKH